MTIQAQKSALRTRAMARRGRAHASVDLAPALARLLDWIAARDGIATIAAYAAMRTEADPAPALLRLHELGHSLCLPVVVGRGLPLEFRRWAPGQALVPGGFGAAIPEPAPPVRPDLVIAPLLAFDRRCHRLGYGGGYYDRTLAALRATGPVPAIGLAYAAQRVPHLPVAATDMPLDAVATEAALHLPA